MNTGAGARPPIGAGGLAPLALSHLAVMFSASIRPTSCEEKSSIARPPYSLENLASVPPPKMSSSVVQKSPFTTSLPS